MASCTAILTPRARVEHACFLCSLPIVVGTTYLRWAWIDGGSAATMKVHPACNAYAREMIPEYTDEGVDDGAVESDLRDQLRGRGIDAAEAKMMAKYPDLADLIRKVAREIREEDDNA